jgi:ABC-type transport system involved in multi-copper enzyme maturation permease subunit
MAMLSSSDSAYRETLIIDSGLSLINIFGLFLVGLIILPVIGSEKERHTLAATLAFAVPRSKYLWGVWLGCSLALLINYLVMSALLLGNLAVLGVGMQSGIFRQLFLNFLSLLTLGSFAITFSVFFSYAVSAMLCIFAYLFGHLTTSFQMALSEWQGTFVGRILDLVWYILPDLSLFNLKDIILKKAEVPFSYDLVALVYALSLIFIVIEIARYRLNRESLL